MNKPATTYPKTKYKLKTRTSKFSDFDDKAAKKDGFRRFVKA
jgi:hypothetical protein